MNVPPGWVLSVSGWMCSDERIVSPATAIRSTKSRLGIESDEASVTSARPGTPNTFVLITCDRLSIDSTCTPISRRTWTLMSCPLRASGGR